MSTYEQSRQAIVVTIHVEAAPFFHITATDAFLHLVRWLQHDGIVASATLDIPGVGTLSAVTSLPGDLKSLVQERGRWHAAIYASSCCASPSCSSSATGNTCRFST